MTEKKKRFTLADVAALMLVIFVNAVILGVLLQNFFGGSR